MCWTDKAKRDVTPRGPFYEIARITNIDDSIEFSKRVDAMKPLEQAAFLRQEWARLLGTVDPQPDPKLIEGKVEDLAEAKLQRLAFEVEPGIIVPFLLLAPQGAKEKAPVIVMVAQGGKAGFLKERGDAIGVFLKSGIVVCLVDVRGTGETSPTDRSPGRTGTRTSISQTNLILGQTVLGSQLRDLRTVIRWLQKRKEIDRKRIAIWGDSFVKVNANDAKFAMPLDAPDLQRYAEPCGGQLSFLAALYEDTVRQTCGIGGFDGTVNNRSAYLYLPHSAILPHASELATIQNRLVNGVAAMFPFENVDAWNCRPSEVEASSAYFAEIVVKKLHGK